MDVRHRRGRCLPVALFLGAAALGGCDCGDIPFFFTDVTFTPDGRGLVLESPDGVFAAFPPTESPQKVLSGHCESSASRSLDCVRMSLDGRRLAALVGPAAPYTLEQVKLADVATFVSRASPFVGLGPRTVASGVLDAAFGPDGEALVFAKPGSSPAVASVFLLGPGGAEELLVSDVALDAARPAAVPFAVTPWGVAWPVRAKSGVELWFKPFGDPAFSIGGLAAGCSGSSFGECIVTSVDGTSVAWQDPVSGVIEVFRPQRQAVLPFGRGYGFAMTPSGTLTLRMDVQPDSANVQKSDTAAAVRVVTGALSGELSPDGESLAFLVVESASLGTVRLFVGASRTEGQDRDYGVFEPPLGPPVKRPLVVRAPTTTDVDHAFTGDGRFVVVAARASSPGTARLLSVNVETAEVVALGEVGCKDCCWIPPAGALVICLPTLTSGERATQPVPLDIYDPATGLMTEVARAAIDVQVVFDGSGVVVLDKPGAVPEARLATRDGRLVSLGSAVRVALSPSSTAIATISAGGLLDVRNLP